MLQSVKGEEWGAQMPTQYGVSNGNPTHSNYTQITIGKTKVVSKSNQNKVTRPDSRSLITEAAFIH